MSQITLSAREQLRLIENQKHHAFMDKMARGWREIFEVIDGDGYGNYSGLEADNKRHYEPVKVSINGNHKHGFETLVSGRIEFAGRE